MKFRRLAAVSLFAASFAFIGSSLAASQTFSPEQKQAIESIVHDYLLNNPRILVEVSQKLQQQEQTKMEQRAQKAIGKNVDPLFNDETTPTVGDANGKVNMVEFFDYQCIHCKQSAPVIEKLMKANPNLRIVFKDLPIFGKNSKFAALAGIAAFHLDSSKYMAFHQAMLEATVQLTPANTLKFAQKSGYDVKQLEQAMKNPAYVKLLQNNALLADKIGIAGTPAFIIANPSAAKDKNDMPAFFVPGAASEEALQQMIDKAKA